MGLVEWYYVAGIVVAIVAVIGLFKTVAHFRTKNIQKVSVKGDQNTVVQKVTNEDSRNKKR